jgi:hypothetical protein
MVELSTPNIEENILKEYAEMLLAGKAKEVEEALFARLQQEAARIYEYLLNTVTNSDRGQIIVRQLRTKHGYRILRKKQIQVTIKGGNKIRLDSWYGLAKEKKKGRPKKGRNGTGTHILLGYWGYSDKYSPCYLSEVVRCGVGSASYELAAEQLRSQGIAIVGKVINHITQHVGKVAEEHRANVTLYPKETLAGRRVLLSLDGGRIRSREKKAGRPKATQKRRGYTTAWREPKLLVIAEMDEHGKKMKGTKPLYEATMKGPEDVARLLEAFCQNLELTKAKEIVCIGDGGIWIWNLFEKLIKKFHITDKTTQIVDFFHAAEHIHELAEAHTKKSQVEQKQWANTLVNLLRSGKFDQFEQDILTEANTHHLPELKKHLGYFQNHKQRMKYDKYEAQHLPIGSGIVESAIKRVINQKLKSPGIFWKIENIERMLQLRCALMAGRWNIFMDNFIQTVRLSPIIV